ncbi:Nse1 non-SMC component of SMC5-6 complex-domain-containing protein [Hysterangium stoloniferum]|nr:Nse1 non-SMC component of SMC5-6 complex-domain-containing protein [Hysterangium stoloniferum]
MVSSGDVSRVFLQSIISRRVVSDKIARILWRKCVEAVKAADDSVDVPDDMDQFDNYINTINRHLEPLDFKLNCTADEATGKKIWAMINLKSDELAQIATDFTPVEIAFFKALVDQIILASSQSYSISAMTALRQVNGLKPPMTKTQAESVLANLVAKGWLLKSERGRFSLSSRSLLELQPYLKSTYEDDIHECTVCYELVTKGVGCYTPQCGARLHGYCYQQLHRENVVCPSCQADWSRKAKLAIIGEGALMEGEDSRSTRRKDDDDDDDDDDDSTEVSEEEPTPKLNLEEMEEESESPAPKSQGRRRR